MQKTAETIKNDFVRDCQNFIQFLIGGVLHQAGLCSNLVRGLAAFDPYIMVKRPTEVALRHFDLLYRTFQLRSWVSLANESTCRDEYVELLDHLKASSLPSFDVSQGSPDLIDFLVNLDFMQEHSRLLYLFKLSCLCITSESRQYPTVRIGTTLQVTGTTLPTLQVIRTDSQTWFYPSRVICQGFRTPLPSVSVTLVWLSFLCFLLLQSNCLICLIRPLDFR